MADNDCEVHESRVMAYFIGGFYDKKSNGDSLREILREYGVSMSGNKAQLLQKLARLAAKQCAKRLPEMDRFFSRNRFVRINAIPPKSERLPILEGARLLRSLLLTMYAMKHLRGSAILDAAHDNNAAENALRGIALGRKHYLFIGSDRGGCAAATLYTMVRSAQRHGLDPFAYLRDLFLRIPTHPDRDIHQLLPDNWKRDILPTLATLPRP